MSTDHSDAMRATLLRVDTSLVEAWQSLLAPEADEVAERREPPFDLARHERALRARLRQEMLALVAAAARGDYEEAAGFVRRDDGDPFGAAELEAALAPFLEEYGEILVTPEARRAHHTRIERVEPRLFAVSQVLLDPQGDNLWAIHGEVDLKTERDPEGPLVRVHRIGT